MLNAGCKNYIGDGNPSRCQRAWRSDRLLALGERYEAQIAADRAVRKLDKGLQVDECSARGAYSLCIFVRPNGSENHSKRIGGNMKINRRLIPGFVLASMILAGCDELKESNLRSSEMPRESTTRESTLPVPNTTPDIPSQSNTDDTVVP